ncbi:hypothetical protein AB0I28_12495 [Phytomonospora sp. NPDC050363]|uniref:hypothetical protein n=1 Tax=Phytomonospora sp. NPDC050363 TaxID=3155642 RepID=UPI0033C8D80C
MTPIVWHYVKSLKWSTVGHSEKPVVRIVCNCDHSTGVTVFPDDAPEARHKALTEVIDDHTQHCEDAVAERFMKRIRALESHDA